MRRLLFGLSGVALAAALVVGSALAGGDEGGGGGRTTHWRVTITNLTPPGPGFPGSQPLSPPLLVVHTRAVHVWSEGEIASHGLAAVAEDADTKPLESVLPQVKGVQSVATGEGGPIPSGEAREYMVESDGRFDRLSIAAMLVNTNDGFTGLDSIPLRGRGTTVETAAYDAGSEANNEKTGFIPGPCCGNPMVRDPEGALIRHHEGITGRGDLLTSTYGWGEGPVARIAIERVS